MPYRYRALLAVCFGSYMATMDFSIVNVALPTLGKEFDRGPDTVVWITLISSLVVTGLTLTMGRAGDLFGRKRVYITGWVVFTVGMGAATFAASVEQLVALRFVQAVGVAMAIANGNAIVTDAFPDNQRGRALGTTGAVVGAGLMSGPILGGFVVDLLDWRAIFYLRVPIGLISMVMAIFLVHESEGHSGPRKFDIPGAVTLFAALSTGLLGVNRGQSWGWTSPVILGLLAASVLFVAAFIRAEAKAVSPVISLTLFKIRSFSVSVASLVLNFAGQSAVTFLMPFYLITVRGYSTGKTGFVMATVPSMMLILSPLSGVVSDRWGFRHQTTLGVAIVTAGLLSLSTIDAGTSTALIMARLAVIGIGTAIFQSPNSSAIMGSVPRNMLGTASASIGTSRNIGNAIGLAMSSAILVGVATAASGLSGVRTDKLPPDALLDGIRMAFLVAGLVSSLAIFASLLRKARVPTLERVEEVPAAMASLEPAMAHARLKPQRNAAMPGSESS